MQTAGIDDGPSYRPPFWTALVLLFPFCLFGCGSPSVQSKARGILTKSFSVTQQLEETFHALDLKAQSRIVAGDDFEMVMKELSTHRQLRDQIQTAFARTYEAIAFALLDPNEIRLIAVAKAHTLVEELFYAWAKRIK